MNSYYKCVSFQIQWGKSNYSTLIITTNQGKNNSSNAQRTTNTQAR